MFYRELISSHLDLFFLPFTSLGIPLPRDLIYGNLLARRGFSSGLRCVGIVGCLVLLFMLVVNVLL